MQRRTSLVAQTVKNLHAIWKTWGRSLPLEDLLKKGMATHSSILTWRIPWTEEPGKLQSIGLQRVRQDWATNTHKHTHTHTHTHIHTHTHARVRKEMGFPGSSDGKESTCNAGDLGSITGSRRYPGEGNGYAFQYSFLRIPCTEEPGGLQSTGSPRVGHNWATNTFTLAHAKKQALIHTLLHNI